MASCSISGWSGSEGRTMTLTVSTNHNRDNNSLETVSMKVDISGGASNYYDSHLKVWAQDLDTKATYTYFEDSGEWSDKKWFSTRGGSKTFYDNWTRKTTSRSVRVYITGYALDYKDKTSSVDITIPKLDSYTISYDANGGVNAPVSGLKWYGSDYTVSSDTPTRSDGSTQGYTVAFNSNEGDSDTQSLSSTRTIVYSFKEWLSSSDNTSYSAGDKYSVNASTTMTAQWNISYVNNSVVLPSASRIGYLFNGWYTSSSGGTRVGGIGDDYTPSEDITLYAQWEPQGSNIISITSTATIDKDTIKVSWVPYNTEFAFKLKMSIKDWSYETTNPITPRSLDTYTYTLIKLPVDVARRVPTDSPGEVTVTLYTYLDSTMTVQLGTSTAIIKAVVPDEQKYYPYFIDGHPIITQGIFNSGVDAFVQTLSNVKSTVSVTGAYGSVINEIKVVISQGVRIISTLYGGFTPSETVRNNEQEMTNPINISGDITVNVIVTDSRKRTCVYTQNIYVYRYAKPFAQISLDASAASSTARGTIYSINGLNDTFVFWVRHKVSDGESTINDVRYPTSGYINLKNDTHSSYSDATGAFTTTWVDDPGDLLTETYEYTIYVTDKYFSLPFNTISAIACISRFAGGKGVRLFGEAYQEGFMVGDIDYTLSNDAFIELATDLSIPFDSEVEILIHQFVTHNNILYKCIVAHQGSWDSSHFEKVSDL